MDRANRPYVSAQNNRIQTSDDCAFFLPDDEVIFRVVEGEQNYVYRSKPDGTERHKISDEPIFDTYGVSHDGRWVLAVTHGPDGAHPYSVSAIPVGGGPTVPVCLGLCTSSWDRTGKSLYITVPNSGNKNSYVLPLQHNGLPVLPAKGVSSAEDLVRMKVPIAPPGVMESEGTPSFYAYTHNTVRRNLYRIPLP